MNALLFDDDGLIALKVPEHMHPEQARRNRMLLERIAQSLQRLDDEIKQTRTQVGKE
jgi:hypothetical protein